MIRFIVRRLLWMIPTLFIVTFLVFVAIRIGTDPGAELPAAQPAGQRRRRSQQYNEANGLTGNARIAVLQLAAATSSRSTGADRIKGSRPVWPELKARDGQHLRARRLIATFVGVAIGLRHRHLLGPQARGRSSTTARQHGGVRRHLDPAVHVSAILLQLFFAVTSTRWLGLDKPLLPTSGVYPPGHQGFDLGLMLKHLILPVTVVAIQIIAVYSRYMRASLLEVKNSDYLRTARAKGISERRVLVRHALRNALIPIVTVAAIDIGAIIGGLIITESIFEYHGMGDFFLDRLRERRLPAADAVDGLRRRSASFCNLFADVLYAVLDPRIRLD